MEHGQSRPGRDHAQPHGKAPGAENRSQQGQRQAQEALGVEQRNAQPQGVSQPCQQCPALSPLRPFRQLGHIRRRAAVQKVGVMKLGQQANRLVLGRLLAGIVEAAAEFFPDVPNRAASVHHAHHVMGGGRQPIEIAQLMILEHVPGLAPETLAVKLGVRSQAGPQLSHAVPRRAEERFAHGVFLRSSRPSPRPWRDLVASAQWFSPVTAFSQTSARR